jgi:cytidine deaminase
MVAQDPAAGFRGTTMHQHTRLLSLARRLVRPLTLSRADLDAATVGCALLAGNGRTYTGVCVSLSCGLGFCAEAAAIADMLKDRETRIRRIVAVSADAVLPPCGRCREMMVQVDAGNFGTEVLIAPDRVTTIAELLPHHWLAKQPPPAAAVRAVRRPAR